MPVATKRMLPKPATEQEAWPGDSLRIFDEVLIHPEAWSTNPRPSEEARRCLAIARTSGDIAAMRALIAVTEQQRAMLALWAREEPDLAARIGQAIAFREAVLRAFDELTSGR